MLKKKKTYFLLFRMISSPTIAQIALHYEKIHIKVVITKTDSTMSI